MFITNWLKNFLKRASAVEKMVNASPSITSSQSAKVAQTNIPIFNSFVGNATGEKAEEQRTSELTRSSLEKQLGELIEIGFTFGTKQRTLLNDLKKHFESRKDTPNSELTSLDFMTLMIVTDFTTNQPRESVGLTTKHLSDVLGVYVGILEFMKLEEEQQRLNFEKLMGGNG